LYVHMKTWSVTAKTLGSTVVAGEYLGVVGSSGASGGPHLHFEVWDHLNNVVDPWMGPCNIANPSSWWANQLPYYDSALNKISTHSQRVEWGECPNADVTHISNSFLPGSTIYFYAFGRDALMGDRYDFHVYRPDNSEFSSWSLTFNLDTHWSAISLGDSITIPPSEQTGNWRYDVDYKGVTYQHQFEISQFSAVTFAGVWVSVNQVGVELSWELNADEPLSGFRVYRSSGENSAAITLASESRLGAESRRCVDTAVTPGETYVYSIAAVKPDGTEVRSCEVTASIPLSEPALSQNFPNPFNPSTTIRYTVSKTSPIILDVFDTEGRLVVTLLDRTSPTGTHSVTWDGKDRRGNAVSSGLYFYKLVVGSRAYTKKMVLLR